MNKINEHERRQFLKGSAAAVVAASGWGWRPGAASGGEDEEGVHGMLIVGGQTVFLSHLPIFGAPHDYQVILEAAFSKAGSDPQADYFNDRKGTRTKIYTLEPERFVLTRLAAAAPLRSFKANVYRGHFERFRTPRAKEAARIAQNVEVSVTRVVHFRKFDPAAAKPAQLEYLLFGKSADLFLAHVISKPPDFDHILAVTALNRKFSEGELGQGVPIVFPGNSNVAAKRIRGVGPVTGRITGAGGGAPTTLQLQPGIEFYFEEEELAS